MLLVSITSPFVGGVADHAGLRKRLLGVYTASCVAAVASFTFLEPGAYFAGFLLILVANVGMEGGMVFYNSFLPQIAPPLQGGCRVGCGSRLDPLAAHRAAAGQNGASTRSAMVAVFLRLLGPAFLLLPRDERSGVGTAESARRGYAGAVRTLREIWGRRQARRFLLAYLVYEDGVNTVIIFSSSLAATTFGFAQGELIALYLVVQITALLGAFALALPIDTWGPKVVSLAAARARVCFVVLSPASPVLGGGLSPGWAGSVRPAPPFRAVHPGRKEAKYRVYSLSGRPPPSSGAGLRRGVGCVRQRPAISRRHLC
jgi:UMF1 family MFS transporter